MAQDYGAAKPLMDFVEKGYDLASKLGFYDQKKADQPSDTAKQESKQMNDDAVKRANESFAKKDDTQKPPQRKKIPRKR